MNAPAPPPEWPHTPSDVDVLLADDHRLVRGGLRLLLESLWPGCRVAEADDGREAVQLARRHQPALCLLDLSMPGLNGLDALPMLAQAAPAMRVLAVSMHTDARHVAEAMRAGALGYLVKDAAVEELADAVRSVLAGQPYLSRRVAATVLAEFARQGAAADTPRPAAVPNPLSARQREVLQLIAEGHSTRDIAERLHLSVKTVETHRAELMRRLQIFDVAGLTRYAMRHGMISPDGA